MPPKTLHNVYHGLVQSHFDFCSVVWDNCGRALSDKLQRLQNHAAHVLTYSSYDADAIKLIKNLDWINLETRRQILKAGMVYKSVNGLSLYQVICRQNSFNEMTVIASHNL